MGMSVMQGGPAHNFLSPSKVAYIVVTPLSKDANSFTEVNDFYYGPTLSRPYHSYHGTCM